jgi:cell division protein FtsL
MTEQETDILVAEPEEEVEESSLKSTKDSGDLLEIFYKPTEKAETENKTLKKESDTFVNYNYNHLNKVYKKYDVVETYVPKKETKPEKSADFEKFVTEQKSYTPERETLSVESVEEVESPAQKPVFRLKQKAKAWLVCFGAIAIMLCSLCICNAVSIKNLNNSIDETTVNMNNINKDIETTIKNIGKLTDADEIKNNASDLGLTEVDDAHNITIELNEKNVVEDYNGQTNFFDEICNFIRSLFGGN